MPEQWPQLEDLGTLVRRYRRAARLSQEELAARASVAVRTLSDIERGASRSPHRETVRLIAEALRLSPEARAALEAAIVRRPAQEAWRPPAGMVQGPPLAGRWEELALLERHLGGEGPPVLLLAGEPGSGKSRLLAEAAVRAEGSGRHVLMGGCQRSAGQEPYAPLPDALKRCVYGRPAARLRTDLRGCAWLVRLLPELSEAPIEPLPAWNLAPAQERRLIAEALARFLDALAGPAGVLLALDDLQWASSDCLELLVLVLRATDPSRVRVIGAYRDTELLPEGPLATALADLAHAGLGTHHALAPLSHDDASSLLRSVLSEDGSALGWDNGAIVEQALARAGGLPFVLVSYARSLLLHRSEPGAPPLQVPWDVAQSVRQRLAAMPESARSVLQTGAVIGRELSQTVLLRAARLPEETVIDALDAACRGRLLIDDGDAYRFTHDLIREVIDAELGSARRRATHRRVAEAMELAGYAERGEGYAALAYHFSQGEQWERALEYLVKAGDFAATVGASSDALASYTAALDACDRLDSDAFASKAQALDKRASLLLGISAFGQAERDFTELARLAAAAGDGHAEAFARARRAVCLHLLHDLAAAEASHRAALRLAGDTFVDVCFYSTIGLGVVLLIFGRHKEAAPLLASAQQMAGAVDAPMGQARLARTLGLFFGWRGEFDAAVGTLENWRDLPSTPDLSDQLGMQWVEGLARAGRGEYEQALAVLKDLLPICERLGETFNRSRALNTIGWIYGELQDHEQALTFDRASLALAEEAGVSDVEVANNARLNLGDSLRALGRLDEAEAHYRAVESIVRKPTPHQEFMLWRYSQHLFHGYGELWLVRGDLVTARRYADECLDAAQRTSSRKNIVKARRLRGQALLAEGRLNEAAAEIELALEVAREVGNPPQLWQTYAALGEVRSAQGRLKEAQASFQEACRVIDGVAAGLREERLRSIFLQSEAVQRLRVLASLRASGESTDAVRRQG